MSRKGRSPQFEVLGFWRLLGRKGRPKGAFLKTMKIEDGTKNQLFIIGRRWDPLKTVPGSGLGPANLNNGGHQGGPEYQQYKKRVVFEILCDFLKSLRAKRLGVYRGFFNKCDKKDI